MANGIHIKMTLDTPTVELGREIKLTVEARNDSGNTRTIGGGDGVECILGVTPIMRSAPHTVSDYPRNTCDSVAETLEPGHSVSIPTFLVTFAVELPEGARRGRYPVGLHPTNARQPDWITPPLQVEVIAPDLSGHLEVARTDFRFGDKASGTVVINNKGSESIDYCGEWTVVLEQNGTTFDPGSMLTACYPRSSAPRRKIAVGTTRLPFSVFLSYKACAGTGAPTIEIPKCRSDGSSPPLPPGKYEIAFRSFGAFGSLHMAPVTITVR